MARKHLAACEEEATKEVLSKDNFAPLASISLRRLLKRRRVSMATCFADAWTESNDTSSIQTSRLETLRLAVMLAATGCTTNLLME